MPIGRAESDSANAGMSESEDGSGNCDAYATLYDVIKWVG